MDGEDDGWLLNNYEQHCVQSTEEQPNYEQLYNSEVENSQKKLWSLFQETATSVAVLYKDGFLDSASRWIPFQSAAGNVTILYKESCDTFRRVGEVAMLNGYNKRNKDLISWAKKKRRLISREDLLAYLAGKPLPPRPSHYGHHIGHHRSSPRPRNISPPPAITQTETVGMDGALHTFRDALSRGPSSRRSRTGGDLCAFISSEFSRHYKRSASPSDVTMGSPTLPKRSRYT